MIELLRIYLSGSIKKGRLDPRSSESFWTDADEDLIHGVLGPEVELLNPAKTDIRRGDYFANYGCDLHLIADARVVLVDLRIEKGIGVGAELMFAQFIGKPVVGWLPPNSYYRRDVVEDVFGEDLINWVHPFAYGLCDHLADSLEDACEVIKRMAACESFPKVPGKSPDESIRYFLNKYPAFSAKDAYDSR